MENSSALSVSLMLGMTQCKADRDRQSSLVDASLHQAVEVHQPMGTQQEQDPTTDLDAAARVKKHAGPRKRRPKKKNVPSDEPAKAEENLPASPTPLVVDASSKVLGELMSRSAVSTAVHDANSVEPLASDRAYWTQWVIEAAEKERARRLNVLRQLQEEEEREILRRRSWAIAMIEKEQQERMRELFLDNMKNTQWFQSTISRFANDYEVVCPNSWFGCTFSCMLKDLESHVGSCRYRQVPDTLEHAREDSLFVDFYDYDVVCPNAVMGCKEICSRENLAEHLAHCPARGISREKEMEDRLEDRRNVLLATEQERVRRMDEQREDEAGGDRRFSFGHLQRLYEEQTTMLQAVLHDEILEFARLQQQDAQHRAPWIEQAIATVKHAIQQLWGDLAQIEGYGSYRTKLYSNNSDVDLVVFGVTEQFKLSCQQCVLALAAHFAAHAPGEFMDISAITRASVPLVKVQVVVSIQDDSDNLQRVQIPFDITFDDPKGLSHNGIASVSLVQALNDQFYGLRELTLVLKHFLVQRGLNDPYIGGLSSYGLFLMIAYILIEQGAFMPFELDSDDEEAKAAVKIDLSENSQAAASEQDAGLQTPVSSARCEAQKQKGVRIAEAIVSQARTRMQDLSSLDPLARTQEKQPRAAVLPPFLRRHEQDHEMKPFLLGKRLMDFLQFYGNNFRQQVDKISLFMLEVVELLDAPPRDAGFASPLISSLVPPASPNADQSSMISLSPPLSAHSTTSLASSPPTSHDGALVILDPLDEENNVGKTCYRVSQVFREFSDFLSFLTALIVRGSVMTTATPTKKMQPLSSGAGSTSDALDNKESEAPKDGSPSLSSPSCRILMSAFEMKRREPRSSLDLSS